MSDAERGAANWHEFTQDVTMHGVRYVHLRKIAKFRRVIWLVLILGSIAYFGFAVSIFLSDYTRRMVNTKIRVEKADELQFPTVTVCNKNLWTLTTVFHSSLNLQTFGLFEIFKDLYEFQRPKPPPLGKYNWSDPVYAPIANLTVNDTTEFLLDAAHKLELSVDQCVVFGAKVNCTDVFEVVATEGGYCFQFNSDGDLNATSAGKTGGISFTLDTHISEYMTGPQSSSEGFSVTFHDAHEVPLVTELSVGLSPGTESNIMLHKSSTNRKPPPADNGRANCLDTLKLPNPLHYYKNYSYAACQIECKTEYVINKCGCRDALLPPLNDTELCLLPTMLNCSNPALINFPKDEEGLKKCQCKDPCSDSEYTAKISSYKFPSFNYAAIQGIETYEIAYITQNHIMVNIFYGKMSYQRLDEEFAYTIVDMIANFGGTLGLCVGASILTICEFLEYGLLSLIKCLTKSKKLSNLVGTEVIQVKPAVFNVAA